jgi:hypothetical protein
MTDKKLTYYERHKIERLQYQNEYYSKNRDEIRCKQNKYFTYYYYIGRYKNKKPLPEKTAKTTIIVTF